MKKAITALMIGMSVLALAGCTKNIEKNEKSLSNHATVVPEELNTTYESDQVETSGSKKKDESLLPDNFDEISNNERIIDSTSLVDVVTECLTNIGVSNLQKVVFGNYREDSTSAVIDGFVITDMNKKLLVDAAYEVSDK